MARDASAQRIHNSHSPIPSAGELRAPEPEWVRRYNREPTGLTVPAAYPKAFVPQKSADPLDDAVNFLRQGKPEAAVALLVPMAGPGTESHGVWHSLGEAYGMLDRHADAEAAFRSAIRLRPDAAESHHNLALSVAYQNRLDESIAHFLRSRQIQPDNPALEQTLLTILLTVLQSRAEMRDHPLRVLDPLKAEPLVSVIMPTKDRPRLLETAVKSVLAQSYRHWEIVIVNDGGADATEALRASVLAAGDRIRYLNSAHSIGQAAARNAALDAARGDVLAFLDDDDIFLPHHLAMLVGGLRTSNAGFAYAASELVKEEVSNATRMELERTPMFPGHRYSRNILLVRNFIPINSWAVRRECIDQAGGFDEDLRCLEDWELLLRLSAHFSFHQMTEVTSEVRYRGATRDSVSGRNDLAPVCAQIYRRFAARGDAQLELARALYIDTLKTPPQAT